MLGADSPMWVTSMAPLANDSTAQRQLPTPPPTGRADYSLRLHDKQVAAPTCAPTCPLHQFCKYPCNWRAYVRGIAVCLIT